MKKLTILFLLLLNIPMRSQTLTVNELTTMISFDMPTISSSLTAKGWELFRLEKGDSINYTMAMWLHKNAKLEEEAYLTYFYSENPHPIQNENHLDYTIYKPELIEKYKKQILQRGYEALGGYTKNNEIFDRYGHLSKNSLLVFRTSILNGHPAYSLESYTETSNVGFKILNQK